MGKSYAIFNQKGGVGKTTTNINLGACLARKGKRVLLVDIDPQGNTTSGLGLVKRELRDTLYEALTMEEYDVHKAVYHTETKNLDIIPASVDLSGAEVELIQIFGREILLRNVLAQVKDEYDFIFIDCPPSLELLTLNGLCAADSVLIPVQCEYYALEGLSDLLSTVRIVKKKLNPSITIEGVLLTMYDGRTNLSIQVAEEVKHHFPGQVYATVIPRNVRLSEAPSHGKPALAYDKFSRGAEAYQKLAEEILEQNP